MRTIKLKIDGDTRSLDAKTTASIRRLRSAITDFNKTFASIGDNQNFGGKAKSQTAASFGFNAEQIKREFSELKNLTKEQTKFAEIRYRSEIQLAQEAAKQVTQAKLSELRQFENVEKSKQRLAETTARHDARLAEESARQRTLATKSELRVFESAEKSRQRLVEMTARAQIRQAEMTTRALESQKRREFQDAQRIQRQKASLQLARENRFDVGDLASAGGAILASATLASGVTSVLQLGAEYEKSMSLFQATTKATAAEMKAASARAVELGNDLKLPNVSAADAGAAMTALGKNGLTAQQSMDAVRGTLLLAAAAGIKAAEAADIQANALNTFNLKATESNRVANLLAAAANASSAEITDIAQSLQQVGAVASAANISIETTVALIAELANRGIKGSDAGTSIKTMIQRLQSPTKDAAAEMEKLKIKIYDQAGAMRSMKDIIGQFEGALRGLTQQQRDQAMNTIFGSDAVRAATIVFGQGTKGFNDMTVAVQRANAAQELAEARTRGLGGAWGNLKSQAETLGLTIFSSLAPTLTAITLALANFIGLIGKSPGAFAMGAVAVGVFIAALNAGAIANFTLGISQVISTVTVLGKVMIGTASLIQGAIATTIAFTAGWAAVVIGLGAVVWALTNTETAIDRANKVTLDSITATTTALNYYRGMAVEAENLAIAASRTSQAQEQNGEIHNRLNAILGRLDPATQIYIKSLKEEKDQVKAVTAEIAGNIEVRTATLQATLRTTAEGILLAQQQRREETENLKVLNESINIYNGQRRAVQEGAAGAEQFGKSASELRTDITLTSKSILEAETKIGTFSQAIGENEIKLIQAAKGLGLQNDQLRQFFANLGYTTEQIDLLTAAFNRSTQAGNDTSNSQNNLSNGLNNTAASTQNLTNKITDLSSALANLVSLNKQNIDTRLYNVISNSATEAEFRANLKQAKIDLKNDVDAVNRQNRWLREAQEEIGITQRSTGGGGSRRKTKAPNPQAEFRRENRVITGNAQWDKWVYEAAAQYGIDPLLIFALMTQESSFKRGAVSNKGASGLMQLMPATARGLGVTNIFDPKQNIFAGVRYLSQQFQTFGGNTALALAAYNAGPGAVQKYGGIPPYQETQDYVRKISARYQKLKGGKFEQGANFDLERSLAEQSDKLTRDAQNERTLAAIELAQQRGYRPDDDVIRDYNRMQVEQARKLGQVQPTLEQTTAEFSGLRERQTGNTGLTVDREKTITEEIRERLNLEEREAELIDQKVFFAEELSARQEDYNLSLRESQQAVEFETALLAKRNLELEATIEFGKQQNEQYRALMDTQVALDVLRRQNADAAFVTERRRLSAKQEELAVEREITELQDQIANQGVNDGLKIQAAYLRDILELRGREREAIISTNRAQLELSQKGVYSEIQANAQVYDYLNQNIKSATQSVADFKISMADAALKAVDSPFDALLKRLESLPPVIRDVASAFVNLARDIIRAFTQKTIMRLLGLDGGGGGIGGTPNWNPNSGTSGRAGGAETFTQNGIRQLINFTNGNQSTSGRFGGIHHFVQPRMNLHDSIHTSGSGGGKFTAAGGMALGAIGAQLIGGLIGGRVGNTISAAGTGMSLGMALGSVIPGLGTVVGGAIGAGIGAIAGLFMGDPKRKVDKKENMPKLQQGFKDAFKEFSDLIADVDALRVDPNSAMGRGRELRAQIASGFGIEFKSKKYRKQSQALIKQQLAAIDAVPDGLMEQLKRAVDAAKAAGERERRILPEFADGVFMDSGFAAQYGDFKRRNGMMPGRFTGRDTLPSMLAPGEMVLNPYQMQRIREAAGFDVFAFSGVPNYPRAVQGFADGTFVAPSSSAGVSLAAPSFELNFNGNIILEGFIATPDAKAYLETEEGERKVITIVNKRNKNFEVDPIKKK